MKRIKTERLRRGDRVDSSFWLEPRQVCNPGRPEERDQERRSRPESQAARGRVDSERILSVACPWVLSWNPPSLRNGAQAMRQARPGIVPSKGLRQLHNDAANRFLDHRGYF